MRVKLVELVPAVRQYYELAFKPFDGVELKAMRVKFMGGYVPGGDRSNARRAADKGSRRAPLALREHGPGFWGLLASVARSADVDKAEETRRRRGGSKSGHTSGDNGAAALVPLQVPPLPWAGAALGLPPLRPAEQLLWWLRCLELHWATCSGGVQVLGATAGDGSGSADGVTEVVDLTQDSDGEGEPAIANVAAWLEANGGCVVTFVKEGRLNPPSSSKRIKLEAAA